jgi:anti-sigma regulatory factor (Ser/Thr protein kinase)
MDIYGEGGVAIFDVVYSLSFFIVYIYNGTGEAAQPLISVFSGENSMDDCNYIQKLSLLYGIGAGAVITALLVIFPEPILAAFGIKDALMPLAVIALRLYRTGFALVGFNIISENYYQSMEKTQFVFFIAIMRGFAVLLPCSWILSMFEINRINAVWLMYPAAELITLVLFLLFRVIYKEKEARFPTERIMRLTMENDTEKIGELLDRSITFCETWDANVQQTYSVTLVIEEICTSIMRNAMKNLPDGMIRVTILAMENGDFVINVLDNAVVFNPFSIKAKKANAETDFDIDDVSILMIKKKSKEFMYRRNNGFNLLVIRV